MKRFVFVCFFSFLFVGMAFTQEAVLELGGKSGWNAIGFSRNIEFESGRLGRLAVKLASPEVMVESSSDLYLNFDSESSAVMLNNYSVKGHNYIQGKSSEAKFGSGAALCTPHTDAPAMVLTPKQRAFFNGNELLSSFTIEFWICPKVTESGSVILQWRSSLVDKNRVFYQHIIVGILQNKMDWSFANIWQRENKGIDVQLRSKSNIIPNQWSHHLLTYDANTGLIEYRMNGITEAVDYLTVSGKDGSQVLYAGMGRSSDVLVGAKYSGYLDELKISRQFYDASQVIHKSGIFDKYHKDGGRFESVIVDTGGNYSEPTFFEADTVLPEQTGTAYFIRAANNPYNWTDSFPKWVPVCPNCKITGVKGRYIQIAADLYPDGSGQKSPLVNSVKLKYIKDSLPLPPASVWVEPLDGAVQVSWVPSVDFDVKGYLVYFGERSGEYFSVGSPKNAGNVLTCKITGLKNGRIYFFSVAAYDRAGHKTMGNFSKEVWARPKAGKKCAQ
ncbi:MAG: hypothetical protein CR988_05265 [Treponema sp.]|nr:MAG: hypothetical protein CR988_05265 [Treponema sp.]